MMVVDTSALMAVVLNEPTAGACAAALEAEDQLLISAATIVEALIVSSHRNVDGEMASLLDELGFEIMNVTAASARRIADAYRTWGKGKHPADLNFGDCFSYALAKEHGCKLLCVGEDFGRTDITGAL